MSYKLIYSRETVSELNKAYTWYRTKELDLGERFKNTFNKICFQIKDNPKIFKEVSNNHRRAILSSSFPFTVHYLVNDKTLTVKIIGVFHQSKHLDLIKEQLKLRKIHEQKHEKSQRFNERKNQLEKLRQK